MAWRGSHTVPTPCMRLLAEWPILMLTPAPACVLLLQPSNLLSTTCNARQRSGRSELLGGLSDRRRQRASD